MFKKGESKKRDPEALQMWNKVTTALTRISHLFLRVYIYPSLKFTSVEIYLYRIGTLLLNLLKTMDIFVYSTSSRWGHALRQELLNDI